jgi:uncharacterized protein (DUF2267 family)
MPATGLDVFDTTLQKTNSWLHELMDLMGWQDRQRAYHGMFATLHALRDRLTVEAQGRVPGLHRAILQERSHCRHRAARPGGLRRTAEPSHGG